MTQKIMHLIQDTVGTARIAHRLLLLHHHRHREMSLGEETATQARERPSLSLDFEELIKKDLQRKVREK
jgi:hypothetical protein